MDNSDACTFSSEYDGNIGARVSSIFVIFVTSTFGILLPVLLSKYTRKDVNANHQFFLNAFFNLARYFGAGVILATAFIHLLAPAIDEIDTVKKCVGGGWELYDWVPCLVLVSCVGTFLLDVILNHVLVIRKGIAKSDSIPMQKEQKEQDLDSTDGSINNRDPDVKNVYNHADIREQIIVFLILEFGVLFHSVIIGLNLGTTSITEFKVLYVVLVFHQCFEGLGLGSRLSVIPFKRGSYMPWLFGLAYGLTTPISIAIGLGVREAYNGSGLTQSMVAGILDALSCGILIYAGLVEYIAVDFLYSKNPESNTGTLIYKLTCLLLGITLMALLGKWA